MVTQLNFAEGWRQPLAEAGLDNFDALMACEDGKRVSWHTRGQTYRLRVGNENIYLKRDAFTSSKDILSHLCCARIPQPPCMVELEALRLLAASGIPAPEPIAWGQRRRSLRLPHQAAIIMRELPGVPLSDLMKRLPPGPQRREAIHAAGVVAGRLYAAGLSWRDLVPKHFFIPEDFSPDSVGVLDVARMHRSRRPRRLYMPKQLRRFCGRLRDCGGSEEEVDVFLSAVNA